MAEHKSSTYIVAIDGSPSSTQAFNYAMQHSTPEDKIVLATGVQHKQVVMTSELVKDPNKIAAHTERMELENKQNFDKAREMLSRFQIECKAVHVCGINIGS